MITKSDLYSIAGVLKHLKPSEHKPSFFEYGGDNVFHLELGKWELWEDTLMHFANMLGSNNPNFKRDKFYLACGYENEHVEMSP